jgi:hypothetical protein
VGGEAGGGGGGGEGLHCGRRRRLRGRSAKRHFPGAPCRGRFKIRGGLKEHSKMLVKCALDIFWRYTFSENRETILGSGNSVQHLEKLVKENLKS